MLNSAQFFAAFDRAGFLVDAAWTPSNDVIEQIARVDFRSVDEVGLGNDIVMTLYSMTYPDTVFIGLNYDEIVLINGEYYKVRDEPRRIQEGGVMRAILKKEINFNRV